MVCCLCLLFVCCMFSCVLRVERCSLWLFVVCSLFRAMCCLLRACCLLYVEFVFDCSLFVVCFWLCVASSLLCVECRFRIWISCVVCLFVVVARFVSLVVCCWLFDGCCRVAVDACSVRYSSLPLVGCCYLFVGCCVLLVASC